MSKSVGSNSRAPEFIARLMDNVMEVLRGRGIGIEAAADAALEIACRICSDFEGGSIYIPNGKGRGNGTALPWFMLEDRDRQIYRNYKGSNRQEVCATYGISEQRLYQIIAMFRQPRPHRNTPQC